MTLSAAGVASLPQALNENIRNKIVIETIKFFIKHLSWAHWPERENPVGLSFDFELGFFLLLVFSKSGRNVFTLFVDLILYFKAVNRL